MSRPPSALESERAALGSALRSAEASEVIAAELREEDFYSEETRKVFRCISDLSNQGLEVSHISVSERTGVAEGTIADWSAKAAGCTAGQLRTIVADVQRISRLRAVWSACYDSVRGISKDAKLEDVLSVLEKGLYRLDRDGASEAKDGAEVMGAVVNDFLERFRNGGGVEVSTGLKALDKAIIGLRGGKMMVIAGRPSMGKTALVDTMGDAVLEQGHGVIQFSLEMSAEETLERRLARRANVNLRKILTASKTEVTDDEYARIEAVLAGGGAGVPGRWFIDDRTYSIAGIRRKARILHGRMARSGVKTGLIILDYIQLAGENGDGREQSVAAISRGCKLMAKELDCTVAALSQLNRGCEARDDRRPLMSDLRESGSIEQDADIVGFVYREHMYDSSIPPEESEFIIRKQRSGPTGTVRLKYNAKTVCFSDVDPLQAPSDVVTQ